METVLSRSPNLKKLLCYVCNKYFEGQAAEIKEYSIAVDAFGRPSAFDPTVDAIVRVEAHRLRNKLAIYYRQKASHRRVQILLPPGSYVPKFVHLPAPQSSPPDDVNVPVGMLSGDLLDARAVNSLAPPLHEKTQKAVNSPRLNAPRSSAMLIAACLLLTAFIGWRLATARMWASPKGASEAVYRASIPAKVLDSSWNNSVAIRILAGINVPTLTDERGNVWSGDRFFRGGDAESISPRTFEFTTTPSLYFHRRRGSFSYSIPIRDGSYELKLHFADAFFGENNSEKGGELSRLFDVAVNGKTVLSNFDVVADAGGSNTADVRVFTDIRPAADGFLHLNFISRRNVAFVNAIEILPAPPHRMLPIYLYAGTTKFKDKAGILWDSDRYFRGGVHISSLDGNLPETDSSGFIDERIGNFVYEIPVATTGLYTAKLRFCNDGISALQRIGDGTNVFDIALNGQMILNHFEMSAGEQPNCIVKQFSGIRPSAQGKLVFSFIPDRGYAFVSSFEIATE